MRQTEANSSAVQNTWTHRKNKQEIPHNNKSSSIKISVTVWIGICVDPNAHSMSDVPSSGVRTESLLCPTNTTSRGGHYNSGGVSLWLAFVLSFSLFLLVCGGAGRRSWVHWRSPQFLGFGFFHFVLDGIDVQLAICRSCKSQHRWDVS